MMYYGPDFNGVHTGGDTMPLSFNENQGSSMYRPFGFKVNLFNSSRYGVDFNSIQGQSIWVIFTQNSYNNKNNENQPFFLF